MEIIKQIMEKTGISEEQAKGALGTVMGSLKGKLPEGIADQLEGLLEGKEFSLTDLATDKLGDLKDSAMDTLGDLKDSATGLLGKLF
ncbi:MAG: DUF2267 domain-containing protein [Bacteroidia bacterium]